MLYTGTLYKGLMVAHMVALEVTLIYTTIYTHNSTQKKAIILTNIGG